MQHKFALEYWHDDGWYVGRLREFPVVFSQGSTLEGLEVRIRDAYDLVLSDASGAQVLLTRQTKPIPQ